MFSFLRGGIVFLAQIVQVWRRVLFASDAPLRVPHTIFKIVGTPNGVSAVNKGITLLGLLAISLPMVAQEDDSWPVITAENVTSLQSVTQIDFADYFDDDNQLDSGWFGLTPDGDYLAVTDRVGGVFVFDWLGEYIAIDYPFYRLFGDATIADIDANDEQSWIIAASVETGIQVIITSSSLIVSESFGGERGVMPASIWFDDLTNSTWLEAVTVSGNEAIVHFDENRQRTIERYPLATDADALIRIGRIEPPFAVTSSPDGLVKRWDLQTGEVTAEAQVENGPAVFGQINASGTHLTWRSPSSETLNLLNFETGENQVVATLNGEYVQYFFVSRDADVIFGAVVEDEPIVVAWDVTTGERYELGTFRECNRVPDMVRLSDDGTTLVVGCDTGLDIWRVNEGD